MRIDVMVDLETLGTGVDATIIQIAAVGFDIKTGEIGAEFNRIADISKNESYEMTVSGATLKWWLDDGKRAEVLRQQMVNGWGSSTELVEAFRNWLVGLGAIGDVYLWGNGILFDNNILRSQMGDDAYPIHFRRDRDVRTIVDVACAKLGCTEKDLRDTTYHYDLAAHDAINDVKNQVRMVHYCYYILMKDNDEMYPGQKEAREEVKDEG